jgi:hypothetical protein
MWIVVHPLGVCFGFLLRLLAWCLGIVGDDGDVLAVRRDLVARDVDRNLTGVRGGLLQIARRVTRFPALVLGGKASGTLAWSTTGLIFSSNGFASPPFIGS